MPSRPRSTSGCVPGPPPAGLPGADDPPRWDRGQHRPDHPGRAGRARRFAGGGQVVRATGLDITVSASDGRRSPGQLSRQGPEVLRRALFEAAEAAARPSSPDTPTTSRSRPARAATGPPWRSPASWPGGCATPGAPGRHRARPVEDLPVAAVA
jgi:hypothetical protein